MRILDLFLGTIALALTPLISAAQSPVFSALTDDKGISAGLAQRIDGPLPQTPGWAKSGAPYTLPLTLPASPDLGQGALILWFYLSETLTSGLSGPPWEESLVSAPDAFELTLGDNQECVGLTWNWRGPARGANALRLQLPSLAKGWHQVAAVWDAHDGRSNLVLDGAPLRIDVQPEKPWTPPAVHELKLLLGHAGLSNVALYDKMLSPEQIRTDLPPAYRGASDHLVGAYAPSALQLDETRLEPIKAPPLGDPAWIMEGPGEVTAANGTTEIRSSRPEGPNGHFVYWLSQKLPPNFVAKWDVQILSPRGLNIVFFCAAGPQGKSIFDPGFKPRSGDFPQYHSGDFDCYHISYYADTPGAGGRATSNLRKNSGFRLVANGPVAIKPGSKELHHVTLVKVGGRIQLAVDGQAAIDWTDDGKGGKPILGGGCFGLRQMQWTAARYSNLQFYALK